VTLAGKKTVKGINCLIVRRGTTKSLLTGKVVIQPYFHKKVWKYGNITTFPVLRKAMNHICNEVIEPSSFVQKKH